MTAGCRVVKDAHELALMKHASAVTLAAYEAAWKALAPGMTQRDFQGLIAAAHDKLGYPGRRQRADRRVLGAAARLDHSRR